MSNCTFCKIVAKEIPAHVIYEDKDILVILDIDPISEGHTLIIPKEDILDIYELSEELGSKIMNSAKKIATALKENFDFDGVMIMQVNGFFQDIPHYHMHVFGRKKEHDIQMTYPTGVHTDPAHLTHNATKLRTYLSNCLVQQ